MTFELYVPETSVCAETGATVRTRQGRIVKIAEKQTCRCGKRLFISLPSPFTIALISSLSNCQRRSSLSKIPTNGTQIREACACRGRRHLRLHRVGSRRAIAWSSVWSRIGLSRYMLYSGAIVKVQSSPSTRKNRRVLLGVSGPHTRRPLGVATLLERLMGMVF